MNRGVVMKGFVNFVIKNKLAVWILTIVITISGIYSGSRMKMEMIPDITIPYLMVTSIYPGATAEQVMNEVSIPLEKNRCRIRQCKTCVFPFVRQYGSDANRI